MKTDQIREKYLSFFEAKGHNRVDSDSLIPHGDPTLLFTGAGMNQFKDYFLGIKKDYKRATSSQKCIRTGDLEEVGRTAFHHSFFEMLGNFSFGDYFKEETIHWAWQFLTDELNISKDRLRVSVHKTDDESYKIWKDKIGIREDWIYKLGDKGNFWPSNAPSDGPDGPCGPCSEIYYDQHPEMNTDDIDSPKFAEIWNLVFTQFNRKGRNNLVPLEQKNIDTGMGLERLACVLQGKTTNFEIDIFTPLNDKVRELLNVNPGEDLIRNLYAISDHVRGVTFAITDGVIPSNEGRGYVIRKLIRRALWHAHQISGTQKIEKPFLYEIVPVVSDVMKSAYPEVADAMQSVRATVKGEEERFLDTLETGLEILKDKLDKLEAKKLRTIPGDIIFELYDTYGFPEELTRAIGNDRDFDLDTREFEKLMQKQRERAKQASQISKSIFVTSSLEEALTDIPPTNFLGYDSLEGQGKILYFDQKDDEGIVVLDETPFYGESGGQVGDQGILESGDFSANVTDTQKQGKHHVHILKITKGSPSKGLVVTTRVDSTLRENIMRNHTATHLLHAALRAKLGDQVRQLGSLVTAEKLRFDFSYPKPLTREEIADLEDSVNSQILKNVRIKKESKSLEEAKRDGAVAFFGEKYDKEVRVVDVPGFSMELCGGTHCESTGQIGSFVITAETSVASGTRRIEAITGSAANRYFRELRAQLIEVSSLLKSTPDEVTQKVVRLQDSLKKLEKERKNGKLSSEIDVKEILNSAKPAGVFRFVAYKNKELEMPQLRKISDTLRDKGQQTVYLLVSEKKEKINVLMGVSKDLKKYSFDVRDLFTKISDPLGASGGGRPDMVQAGGSNSGQLDQNWVSLVNDSVSFLKQTDIEKTAKN